MPVWVGFAVKGGIILAFVGIILWLFWWLLNNAQERQMLRDTRDRLVREQEEEQRKIKAAQAAEEVRREAHRDPVTGLPVDERVRPVREGVVKIHLGQPPAGGTPPAGPDKG